MPPGPATDVKTTTMDATNVSVRRSMSGLLDSPIVCGDDSGFIDNIPIKLQNGSSGKRHSQPNIFFNNNTLSYNGMGGGSHLDVLKDSPASRLGLNNGERSSDSEDSMRSVSVTTSASGKEASPGYEESSGSEPSSGPPLSDEGRIDEHALEPTPPPRLSRHNSIPRSQTTPTLNGGGFALDEALRPLSGYGDDVTSSSSDERRSSSQLSNGLSRIRAAHELNISKLQYLEALFQSAKLEEYRLKNGGRVSSSKSNEDLLDTSNSERDRDQRYKPIPSFKSDYSLRSLAETDAGDTIGSSRHRDVTLPDGQTLLKTIENRLQGIRNNTNGAAPGRSSIYQCGGSNSVGSLSRLTAPISGPSISSTPARSSSLSRAGDTLSSGNAPSSTPSGVLKGPDGHRQSHYSGGGGGGHVSKQQSLPHQYRSRSAYSSPAVSPQRGPDPNALFTTQSAVDPAGGAPRRFSSLDLRNRASLRQLPLRHTAHGFPTAVLPLSPSSPAQGAAALHRKMQLFLEIMETQSRFHQDLQSEIETHKDVLASLNATGQKLLGTLENQDEAVMLQRRLEEMNQRWNSLKHKSVVIRTRLEGNAENWNTLLLSIRELLEWVIRKDSELSSLGPLVGDIHCLAKFCDDITVFRRVIDEKQQVIENNLKSGRQLIASEPALSDTSDSEAGRDLDGDARYRGEDSGRELMRAVRREVSKLSEKWAALRERAAATAAQSDLAHKKLSILQKTVEDISGRMEEAEKTVATWSGIPQDLNLADQHAHNVRQFREDLADLQRGIDDVNDQATKFSAQNVPLTPNNSAKIHDLNSRCKNLETAVNDRWRQLVGRSREMATPLTPAQLASSVAPPWERATNSNSKVPYYINHDHESTHWDHPLMMEMLDGLTEFNHIKFSAYRTATKLRVLQKKLALNHANMQMATDLFDEHGLRGQNDRLIDVNDIVIVLSALYSNISADHPEINIPVAMDLCLNWLLNVYDSQRTGQMRVLSFKIGLVCLCRGHLEEKYRFMFRLIADPNRLVDQRKLGLLLHDCIQVPRQLGEVASFGGSNIEPSVRSCFAKAGIERETIEAVHFLSWVKQEPQSLVWLAVLHRVAASENLQHQVKCNTCKASPIIGLRYRCLKCLNFDMCQRCFFDGRSGKSHKVTHPMHEYCTAKTAGEDVKDFTKALKNKFKSKRSLQKHTKKGYLPVQTVLEGDALKSPSPSPQHNTDTLDSQDMHSQFEAYASRLAEVEHRTNSNSTPDSEDEHGLIAQYCQSLSSSGAPLPVPRSPLQIMAAVDADQKDELEQMIRDLEDENEILQAEYDHLKSQQPAGFPTDDLSSQRSETEMLAEAKLLRQHKGRLEARMGILEEHNRQLETQLHRLRELLGQSGGQISPNKSGTLQTKSVTASQLAMDSPARINGHSNQGDLGQVVGDLVATMNNQDQGIASPSHISHEDYDEYYDNLGKEESINL